MKNNFLADYLGCILFKALGPVIRSFPLNLSFFLGRRLGDILYYFDFKHKAIAYANIKKVFGTKLPLCALSSLTREFYQSFGQSLIEVFLIPVIDRSYINKYVTIEGKERVFEALKKGKGVILATVHAGSWELANIISANLGFPFYMFVREQGLPKLNNLLNEYRKNKGCRILSREEGLKDVIRALGDNEAVGITVDQGGIFGLLVDFFGRPSSMPKGAVKLVLKHETPLIPIFFTRINGPRIKVWAGEEIVLSKDNSVSLEENMRRVISVFESFILKYPEEYLWTYKIWKRSSAREILILSDGRTGHLRQSEAVAKEAQSLLAQKNIRSEVRKIEVKFKNKFSGSLFNLCVLLSGKYSCQGCLICLRKFLSPGTYKELSSATADIIISAGSSIAGVNFILSRENLSKPIVIMRPAYFGVKKFSLVITPRHDRMKSKKNIVITDAALNLIDEEYLNKEADSLAVNQGLNKEGLYIGVLIGGDSKNFKLSINLLKEVIKQIKRLAQDLKANILLTTSRRTSKEAVEIIKNELSACPYLKLMIIANEGNIPQAVGGILGLSSIIISTPESISMISEAVSSKKYVFVFNALRLDKKHKNFLRYFNKNKYIHICESDNLGNTVKRVWQEKPVLSCLQDRRLVSEALTKVL
ncbi:MAG: mitochondrial fission ELM1 family protein [Candidatus Omnitrophica bacterium]|nr:mitochondrial fission ELM1 family protein [Candidatus Omnitrophota bacterium]